MQLLPLSFQTAKDLRARMEMLPKAPQWRSMPINVEGYPTKVPMSLYYQDALECVEYMFGQPSFAGHIDYCPRRLWKSAERLERIYTEWMTGDSAWEMQVDILLHYLC
jgi:Plavaka transposase